MQYIDVTGFRYARRHMFKDNANNQERLGWENTLKSDNPEDMMKFLFDSTVFSNRFVLDEEILPTDLSVDVMKTIVDVLKSKISLSDVYAEVLSVRTWLQAQNLELAVALLKTATEEAYGALNPKVKPQRYYLERLIKHNKSFLNDCIQVAYDLRETNAAQLETVPSPS